MANWKKMAEAFGRAMNERIGNGNKGARAAINESEIAKAANNGVTKDPDIDAIRAYRRGQDEGALNYYAALDRAPLPPSRERPRSSDISRKISEIEDENSDEVLKTEFDRGFKEAVARRKGKSGINRSYLERRGLSPEEIDQIDTDENRRILIDLLKKNSDTGDVLDNFN